MRGDPGRPIGGRTARVLLAGLLGGAVGASVASGGASPGSTDAAAESAVRTVIATYEHAIESKSLDLFRSVKPNLSGEEEKRLRAAFGSTGSHEVEITIVSIRVEGNRAEARLSRRDTLEGSIVSSFPQTLRLVRGPGGWAIEEIGR